MRIVLDVSMIISIGNKFYFGLACVLTRLLDISSIFYFHGMIMCVMNNNIIWTVYSEILMHVNTKGTKPQIVSLPWPG